MKWRYVLCVLIMSPSSSIYRLGERSVLAGNSGGGMHDRLQESTSSRHVEDGGEGPVLV